MAFSENLKQIRKQKGISQEELAEILDVSRQAVSKWEQNAGYPEVETLLLLSNKLGVSLDALMSEELIYGKDNTDKTNNVSGRILIKSYDNKSIVNCYKVTSNKLFMRKKKEKYANYVLFGVDSSSFWGDNTTPLGFYSDQENMGKEIKEIMEALKNGDTSYELKYAEKVKARWGGMFSLQD